MTGDLPGQITAPCSLHGDVAPVVMVVDEGGHVRGRVCAPCARAVAAAWARHVKTLGVPEAPPPGPPHAATVAA